MIKYAISTRPWRDERFMAANAAIAALKQRKKRKENKEAEAKR